MTDNKNPITNLRNQHRPHLQQDPFKQREAAKYIHPIASREHILACLTTLGIPTSVKHLAKLLGVEQAMQHEALNKRLRAMVRDGQLIVKRRNTYAIASPSTLVTGTIIAHPEGFGFLASELEKDIYLGRRQMRQVLHGDRVSVRPLGEDRRGRITGDVVEVLERNTQQLVGSLYMDEQAVWLRPFHTRITHEVRIHVGTNHDYQPGQIAVVRITAQPSLHDVVQGEVIAHLGSELTPGVAVEVALRNNNIPTSWPESVLEYLDSIPDLVQAKDKRHRFDLTKIPFVTIDGEDARDFDDAVYCEPKARGGWRLYVAIADVGHYVKPGSPLDQAAQARGTSVYFPQHVAPMLPEPLSNGICSLKPQVERLVIVCEMTISARGLISSYVFYEGCIKSWARLTYTKVAAAIQDQSGIRQQLGELAEKLDDLHALYQQLLVQRKKRGAIEFDVGEVQFQFNETGKVKSISSRHRNTAHRIIEECMLCANVCAAKLISNQKIPGLYRVHEPPKLEKVEHLQALLARFKIHLQASKQGITAQDYQQVVTQLSQRGNSHIFQMMLLRSMNQAVYQVENKGHFGLGYHEYTHFTSPIRRYPDLLTHRLIKAVIYSPKANKQTLHLSKPPETQHYPYDLEQMVALGEQTSLTERRADAAVYEVLEYLKCDYISDRVGDILPGVILSVTKFGLFVELADVYIEGLVHINSLASDYYHYDQQGECLVGENTRRVYAIADAVKVQVVQVNMASRKLDLKLLTHTPATKRTTPKQTSQFSAHNYRTNNKGRPKRGRRR